MTEATEHATATRALDRRIMVVWTVQTAILFLVLAVVALVYLVTETRALLAL